MKSCLMSLTCDLSGASVVLWEWSDSGVSSVAARTAPSENSRECSKVDSRFD